MVVPYQVQGDSFIRAKPRIWSEKRLLTARRIYDVEPDGKRITALMPAETLEGQQEPSKVTFLLNFFDELRRRVPVGGK
jgi:hypothetical protein